MEEGGREERKREEWKTRLPFLLFSIFLSSLLTSDV